MVNGRMTFEIYCKEQLTILAKYTEKVKKKVHQKYKDKSATVDVRLIYLRLKNSITYYHIWKKTPCTLYQAC